MEWKELLLGPSSKVYYSSMILVMLALMLTMTTRLFLSRRKKAYFSFSLSLLSVMAQHALVVVSALGEEDWFGGWVEYLSLLLKAVSFILVNLGMYQLYNGSRLRQYVLTWTAVGGAGLLSGLHVAFAQSEGSPHQLLLLKDLGVELYLFLLLFLCQQWITPYVGQWGRYQASLAVYLVYQLTVVADRYVFDNAYPVLGALSHLLLMFYYGVLFLILFERVVELLQATYNKSITDGLTGLYNRRHFMSRLEKYLNHGVPVSVIFTDIDNFKKLNDTLGHDKGDEALKRVARILQELTEDVGIVGRLGGEEMVVLLTDPNARASELAEAARARIESNAGVTVSVGYSKARKGVSADALVKQADEAMYQAKTTGKNKVCKFGTKPQKQEYSIPI